MVYGQHLSLDIMSLVLNYMELYYEGYNDGTRAAIMGQYQNT